MSTSISRAQNFEDVILWRALRHVNCGNYVDIGAQDPLVDSVSALFYEHRWHGIHVEPVTQFANQLKAERPGDLVIQAAVTSISGSIKLYKVESGGLSTCSSEIAENHRNSGLNVQVEVVPAITLDDVFDALGWDEIHWVKIDIEGGEKEALAGWRNAKIKPWIFVIESTIPLKAFQVYANWEPLIIAKGYRFVYFDGLNRFYLSEDHLDLEERINLPPNVFDDFTLSGTATSKWSENLTGKIAHLQKCVTQMQIALEEQKNASSDKDNEAKKYRLALQEKLQEYLSLKRESDEYVTQIQRLTRDIAILSDDRAMKVIEFEKKLESQDREKTNLVNQLSSAQAHLIERLGFSERQIVDLNAEVIALRGQIDSEGRLHATTIKEMKQAHLADADRMNKELLKVCQDFAVSLSKIDQERLLISNQLQNQVQKNVLLESKIAEISVQLETAKKQLKTSQLEAGKAIEYYLNIIQYSAAIATFRLGAFESIVQYLQDELKLGCWNVLPKAAKRSIDLYTRAERFTRLSQKKLEAMSRAADGRFEAEVAEELICMAEGGLSNQTYMQGGTHGQATYLQEKASKKLAVKTEEKNTDAYLSKLPMKSQSKSMKQSPPDTASSIFKAPFSLRALYSLNNKAFVDAAYFWLLKRETDPEGMHHYLNRLKAGDAKIEILTSIYRSKERRRLKVNLPRLRSAMLVWKISHIPVVGAILSHVTNSESPGYRGRQARVFQNKIEDLLEMNQQFISALDQLSNQKDGAVQGRWNVGQVSEADHARESRRPSQGEISSFGSSHGNEEIKSLRFPNQDPQGIFNFLKEKIENSNEASAVKVSRGAIRHGT